jgi:hypothetical protein
VRATRSLDEIVALTSGDPTGSATQSGGSIACTGDGVSGNRVQAVYAYPADGPDNYDQIAPYVRRWAAMADRAINDSAAETGGVRHIRYVTGPDCQVDVARVALTPEGVASLPGTAADLYAQGLNRPDRKYLVWVDAYVYCGMATVKPDDRPGQDNANNGDGEPGMVARVDRGCWGIAASSGEVHELVHILGGVQTTAPNGNWNYHCSDESEVMCYDDDATKDGFISSSGELVPIRYVCPTWHERLLDCSHDDYFSTAPDRGSWLGKHWNVADSSFLTSEGPPSVPDATAPRSTGPVPRIEGPLLWTVRVRLSWRSRDSDVAGYWLWRSVDGRPWEYVPRPNLAEGSFLAELPRGHTYRFLVHAFDMAGNASPAILGPPFAVRVLEERSRAIGYEGRWRRFYRSDASARHVALPRSARSASRLRFYGRGIAWVSRVALHGGRARVYVDGRYVDRVNLASSSPAARQVVYTRRFGSRRWHRISIVPVQGSGRVPVDAFIVLR